MLLARAGRCRLFPGCLDLCECTFLDRPVADIPRDGAFFERLGKSGLQFQLPRSGVLDQPLDQTFLPVNFSSAWLSSLNIQAGRVLNFGNDVSRGWLRQDNLENETCRALLLQTCGNLLGQGGICLQKQEGAGNEHDPPAGDVHEIRMCQHG